jgi:hypothetical protein
MAFNKFYVSTSDVNNPTQLQRTVNTIQQNVEDVVNKIEKNTILDKVTYSGVVINGSATLEHKLKRVPTGYLIIQQNANAQIWNGAITDTSIVLNSSSNVTVSIYIF